MKRRLLITGIAVAAMLSTPNIGRSGSKNVPVCHIPPGNTANAHVIDIDPSALPAHIGVHCGAIGIDGQTTTVCDYRMDVPAGGIGGAPTQGPYPAACMPSF